jgi:hypothetical protein
VAKGKTFRHMIEEKHYLKKLEKLEPLLGKQVNGLMAAFHQRGTTKERLQAGGLIDLLYQQYCLPNLAEPDVILRPPSKSNKGELILGSIDYRGSSNGRVQLSSRDLTRHVGIWGTTGSGKTNLSHILVDQLLENHIPFTIFDWKQNFRSLLSNRTWKPALYFTVGSQSSPFFWNPLAPPPNTDWEDWLKLLIEAMKHAFFLGQGVERVLQQAFFDVAGNIKNDTFSGYPTFQGALRFLEGVRAYGREAMWLDSAKRALGALCFGGVNHVFNVPFSIGPFLDIPVIYGLETLTDSEKTFFTEALCLWTYFARLNQGQRKPLEHVFIMEEAHNVLTRQKQTLEDRESLMDGILRQVCELGESFVIIDQQPSSLTNSALANINTHFVFNMHNEPDIRAICDCIGLNGDDRDYLKLLKPGEAVVKLNGIARPFLAKIPESERNSQRVSDEAIKHLMWSYSVKYAFKKAHELLNDVILAVREEEEVEPEKIQNNVTSPHNLGLGEMHKTFLKSITDNPYLSIVDRYNLLGLTAYMGDKVKDQLIEKGLINQMEVPTAKGRICLLKLTPFGYAQLETHSPPSTPLQGGPIHEYWKHKVAQFLSKKGWNVEMEAKYNGCQYDVVIIR